jgi:nucleotidyltransferase substrate binding protein (TIGR01987 family)
MYGGEDIRWKQRFMNFTRAADQLAAAVALPSPSEIERAGIIQIYQFTFELAWKTLKDFLDHQQVPAKYPREVIREAFHYGLITDGEIWLAMLEKRNLMAHTYSEDVASLALRLIRDEYAPWIFALRERLAADA